MDKKEKGIEDLHRRRRQLMAQEVKEYLSPPKDQGVWAVIGTKPVSGPVGQKAGGKVIPFLFGPQQGK